jgi:Uri superfamily endonuclease
VIDIPSDSGSYALVLTAESTRRIHVGRLGQMDVLPGIYVYFGSAQGPGGLNSRLGRHLRAGGKAHWHIDFFRAVTEVTAFCYITEWENSSMAAPIECLWSQAISALPGAIVPAEGFGSSDCRAGCASHLIALSKDINFEPCMMGDMLAAAINAPQEMVICQRTP